MSYTFRYRKPPTLKRVGMMCAAIATVSIFMLGDLMLCKEAAAQQPQTPPAQVVIDQAVHLDIAPVVEMPGSVISQNDARIAAEVSGKVIGIAEVGTRFETGGVLARIDDRLLQLQLQDNQADIKRLEANLRYLRREVSRLQELARRNNAPARQVDEMTAQRDVAEQELAQARITLERTQFALERTQIRSPFTGQITERLVQIGEYLTVGDDVVRLVDTANLEIRVQVPVSAAPYIRDTMALRVRGQGREVYSPVRTIVRVADQTTRTFELRIDLDPEGWIIGTPVRVAIPTGEPRRVVAVHRDALILRQDTTFVFRIDEENVAHRVEVDPGAGVGPMVEVDGPIQAGDQVVIRGGERLNDGQPVMILKGV